MNLGVFWLLPVSLPRSNLIRRVHCEASLRCRGVWCVATAAVITRDGSVRRATSTVAGGMVRFVSRSGEALTGICTCVTRITASADADHRVAF